MSRKPVPVPELAIDTILYATLSDAQKCERRIVANLCAHLHGAGFALIGLHDGDAHNSIDGATLSLAEATRQVMELAFTLTDCRIWFRKGKLDGLNGLAKAVILVFGNGNGGLNVIADHSAPSPDPEGWNEAMAAFDVRQFASSARADTEPMQGP